MELCRGAKRRALRRGLDFDLQTEDVLDLWEDQQGKCLLSGIPFSHKKGQRGKAHYASPSLDRIDPAKGYSKGNVRLICYGLNCCLHDFGENFFRGLASCLQGRPEPMAPPCPPPLEELTPKQRADIIYRSGFQGTVTALHHSAKKHALEKNLEISITKEMVQSLLKGCTSCAVSGIPFDYTVGLKRANPLRPSLDRIDSTLGYTPGNVRLVCSAVNFGMNEFGEETFRELCHRYLENSDV